MFTIAALLAATLVAPSPHIRSTQPALVGAIADGSARSELFRALVDRLNASDIIVHVIFDERQEPGTAAHLAFAAKAGGVRYLRIVIAPRWSGCDLIAILGHELRHAVEIADEPRVVDQASMAAFYAAVGARRGGTSADTFDTAVAVAAGERIRREALRGGRVDGPDSRP
jgi:hypothetical protein